MKTSRVYRPEGRIPITRNSWVYFLIEQGDILKREFPNSTAMQRCKWN